MKLAEILGQIKTIAAKNNTSKPYLCGGVARDKYMGNLVKISDVDITTGDKTINFLAQETAIAFNKQFRVKQKTHEDGHLSIYFNNLKLDFSSNFISPGINDKLSDLQKEMYSRDFTCNALLLDFDLKSIIDPTGKGKQDIDNKIIRTCLSPEITLTSNKNRVVRAIYLACKLGFDIDQSIIDYVKSNPESIKISSMKTLKEKLELAFKYDENKAKKLLSDMNLWDYVPISLAHKKAYFQGTEQPTPKKQKYKPDPRVIEEPRFDEPFYRNYDLYNVPTLSGKPMGPGAGYHDLMKSKSVSDFLKKKRKLPYKGKERYVDSDGKIKSARYKIYENILKTAIDFQVDENINSPLNIFDNTNYDNVGEFGGNTSYTPINDIDDKSQSSLNFGHDTEYLSNESLKDKLDIYLNSDEVGLYGLPDGLPEEENFEDISDDQEYGTTDSGNTLYHNTWISS